MPSPTASPGKLDPKGQPVGTPVSYYNPVPYGLEESDGRIRYAFFFHYVDFKKPLLTPTGSVPLPKSSGIT